MSAGLAARLAELAGEGAVDTWTPRPGAASVPRVAPADPEAAAEVLRAATADGLRVLPLGAGSKLGWRRLPSAVDLVLSTARLVGVTGYEPGDGTLTALAGTRMEELEARTAAGGHHLTPEAAFPARATLGGVVAAGASGRERLRYGPLRHHVLGVRAITADGRTVQSGGRLVKNVTGYDLHRLLVGSHGTLALVLEASLRLFPRPQERCVVHASCDSLDAGLEAVRRIERAGVRPETLCLEVAPGGGAALWIVPSGRLDVVRDELTRLAEAAPELASVEAGLEDVVLRALRDGEAPEGAHLAATLLPTDVPRVAGALLRAAEASGLEARLRVHPLVATALLAGDAPDAAWIEALARAREELGELEEGGRLALHLRGVQAPGVADPLDGGALPPAARALLGRLRGALDPGGVFARNLLAGGDA